MFISKGKHIKNVYEPNGSQLPLVVIEKNHPSTKDVSKRWAEHPMPPPGIRTRHSPRSKREQPCQDGMVIRERSKMNVRLKLRPDGAVIKERSQPLDRPCSHCSERVRMKTCLARERGTGGRSEGEDKCRWTFVNDEKRIHNALESNRSRLLSGVVKKSCFSTKNVSKSRAVFYAVHRK